MSIVTCQITMSLDGFVAGPNPTLENPLGEGGTRLHEWAIATTSWREQHGQAGAAERTNDRTVDDDVLDAANADVGAHIMGRKMFGGGEGPWDESWQGWWGADPPFHAPVFVLTHHPREPLPMHGGTTFYFVSDGIESALEQARAAAGDGKVAIAGGAKAVQQYLAAGLLDELYLHIAPTFLGSGERLFDNVGDPALEPVDVVTSPAATHIRYRAARQR